MDPPESEPAPAPHTLHALPEQPVTVIQPETGSLLQLFRDIWSFRELLVFFTWRDIKIRYKQTLLGVSWALLQPFTTMLIATLLFGRLGKMNTQTGGVPYPLFVFAGLLPWTFIANALQVGGNSLVGNSNLMTKVFFPRLLLPVSSVLGGLVDLLISFGLLGLMMAYYRIVPDVSLLLLPLLLLLLTLLASAVSAFLAGVAVRFRDVRYALPLMVQSWMLLSPVIWPPSIVPPRLHWLLALNPATGLIDSFRAALLGGRIAIPWGELGVSAAITLLLTVLSVRAFRRMEAFFSDLI